MRIVVFLGPSLPLPAAKQILDAIYLPPAAQSDIMSAVATYRPDVIALIDGVFAQSLSVWHKEILFALERGVHVYGASSMGALRAAETAEFGMIGVGQVYEMFRSGELNDDDEVALAHGEADSGFLPLSEPMVNIRMTFRRAEAEGVIDPATCRQLTDMAKAIFFPERTWALIFRQAAAQGVPPDAVQCMERFVVEKYVDVKRQDAILLLETLAALRDPLPKPTASFSLTRSHLFEALYHRDRTVRHDGTDIPQAAISNYVALHRPDFNDLNFHALNRALVVVLADLLDVTVSEEEIGKEVERFRLRQHLLHDQALAEWQRENDLEPDEFHALMQELALCRRLQRWLLTRKYMEGSVKIILDELRLENRYTDWAEQAADQERLLQEYHHYFKETSHRDVKTRQMVIDHLRETSGRMDAPFAEWAADAGFPTVQDLKIELLRARLARQALRELAGVMTAALSPASPSTAPREAASRAPSDGPVGERGEPLPAAGEGVGRSDGSNG